MEGESYMDDLDLSSSSGSGSGAGDVFRGDNVPNLSTTVSGAHRVTPEDEDVLPLIIIIASTVAAVVIVLAAIIAAVVIIKRKNGENERNQTTKSPISDTHKPPAMASGEQTSHYVCVDPPTVMADPHGGDDPKVAYV